jgi:hypothetical protein
MYLRARDLRHQWKRMFIHLQIVFAAEFAAVGGVSTSVLPPTEPSQS